MIQKLDSTKFGGNKLDWLKTKFHFSFANYYNPDRMNFGVLRVFNDDFIKAKRGFDMHPHRDMEVLTYVVRGEINHRDSIGHNETVGRGEVQYMSAGTGIKHSEYNNGEEELRSLQIWIVPDQLGYAPNYGAHRLDWEKRINSWFHIVSNKLGDAPIKIRQDANLYVMYLEKGEDALFTVANNRQAYLVQVEGSSQVNHCVLNERDALEVSEEQLTFKAKSDSHYLLIEMEKE